MFISQIRDCADVIIFSSKLFVASAMYYGALSSKDIQNKKTMMDKNKVRTIKLKPSLR